MKKVLKILSLFIVLFIVGTTSVNAYCGAELVYDRDYWYYNNKVCINPGIDDTGHEGYKRFTGNISNTLTIGANTIFENGGTMSGADYVAVSEAIRVLSHLDSANFNGANNTTYYKYTLDVYNKVMEKIDPALLKKVKKVDPHIPTIDESGKAKKYSEAISIGNSECDIDRIAGLVTMGLQSIVEMGEGVNKVDSDKLSGVLPPSISKVGETGSNGTKTVTYAISHVGFTAGSYIDVKIKNVSGGTVSISGGGSSLRINPSGNSTNITVVVTSTSASSKSNSCPVNFVIELSYHDKKMGNTGMFGNPGNIKQGFVTYTPQDSSGTGNNEAGVNNVDFPDTIDPCKDTKECSAIVNNNACAAIGGDVKTTIEIKEGYEADGNKCGIASKPNIIDCVIDGNDPAGNPYNVKLKNLANNKYCSVSCKEDYFFEFPGNKETNSGRFFRLEATINGTKTCYTSAIDRKLFDIDYEKAVNESVDAYNRWKIAQELSKQNDNYVTSTTSCPMTADEIEAYIISQRQANPNFEYDPNNVPEKRVSYQINKVEFNVSGLAKDTNGNSKNYSISGLECSVINSSGTTYSVKCKFESGSESCDGSVTPQSISGVKTELSGAQGTVDRKIKNIDDIVKDYNMCSEWTTSYTFDPKVNFWYEEEYQSQLIMPYLVGSGSAGDGVAWYCDLASLKDYETETVTDDYETCKSSQTGSKQPERRYRCTGQNGSYECKETTEELYKTRRMKIEWKGTGNYTTPTQFYTLHPTGEMLITTDDTIKNTTKIENGWVVGFNRKRKDGGYNYALQVQNAGEYFETGSTGRLWGASNSVLSALFERGCVGAGALTMDNIGYANGVYTCVYEIDPPCPECQTEVEIDENCSGKDCPVVCSRCIFLNGKSNFHYRSISTKNINPTNRKLGVNWRSTKVTTAIELKAAVTKDEIEANDETIYDTSENTPYEDVWIKVHLTGNMIKDIKAYNDKQKNNGGYYNNSLSCYDYIEGNTVRFKNLFCYSELIDQLKAKYPDDIEIDKRIDNVNERSSRSGSSGYWRIWPQEMNELSANNWTITTNTDIKKYNRVEVAYEGTSKDIIGPSWK